MPSRAFSRRLLHQLHPRSDAELGVDVGEVGLHGARGHEKPCGDVFIGQTFTDQSRDVALGRCQRRPAAGRPFAFTPTALRVGDGILRVELREALRVITQRISNPRRTGPAPWRPPTELSGPTTLPIEFGSAFVGLPGGDFVGGLGRDVAGQARG
jgi:hypothetical protein